MPQHQATDAAASKMDADAIPPTPTPTPTPTPNRKTGAFAPPPDGVTESVWQDFLKTRKSKVTKTALDGIRVEATKAGLTLDQALGMCCARGWQGFQAEWVIGGNSPVVGKSPVTAPGAVGVDPALAAILANDGKAVRPPPNIRAQIAALTAPRSVA